MSICHVRFETEEVEGTGGRERSGEEGTKRFQNLELGTVRGPQRLTPNSRAVTDLGIQTRINQQ